MVSWLVPEALSNIIILKEHNDIKMIKFKQ